MELAFEITAQPAKIDIFYQKSILNSIGIILSEPHFLLKLQKSQKEGFLGNEQLKVFFCKVFIVKKKLLFPLCNSGRMSECMVCLSLFPRGIFCPAEKLIRKIPDMNRGQYVKTYSCLRTSWLNISPNDDAEQPTQVIPSFISY